MVSFSMCLLSDFSCIYKGFKASIGLTPLYRHRYYICAVVTPVYDYSYSPYILFMVSPDRFHLQAVYYL